MVETHGLYAANARTAARTAGAEFIDLANLSIAYFETIGRDETKNDFLWLTPENANARFPEGVEDNTHFSELGACGVARVIAIALSETSIGNYLIDRNRLGTDDKSGQRIRPESVRFCAAVIPR